MRLVALDRLLLVKRLREERVEVVKVLTAYFSRLVLESIC
jgi:hypothetical protein